MALIPIYGGRGAAISTGIAYITFFVMRTLFSNRYYYVDYSLMRFSILSVSSIIFAAYATFHAIDVVSVFLYMCVLSIMLYLYRDSVKIMFKYGIGIIKKYNLC